MEYITRSDDTTQSHTSTFLLIRIRFSALARHTPTHGSSLHDWVQLPSSLLYADDAFMVLTFLVCVNSGGLYHQTFWLTVLVPPGAPDQGACSYSEAVE